MIKRHENDMLFTLFWYGILERAGGGSKYLDCLEWETYQKVSWFHTQSSFSLYVFVTQACVLYAEWPRVNNLPGQTTVSQFLTL